MSISRFRPEVRTELVDRVAAGASLADAGRAMGLPPQTVSRWVTRGRREPAGTPYSEFVRQLEAARDGAPAWLPVAGAQLQAGAAPMDRDAFALVVSEAARAGSVPAMRLYDEMLQREAPPRTGDAPLAELTEFARRRGAA